jgi:hypothetical protein
MSGKDIVLTPDRLRTWMYMQAGVFPEPTVRVRITIDTSKLVTALASVQAGFEGLERAAAASAANLLLMADQLRNSSPSVTGVSENTGVRPSTGDEQ